MKFHLNEKKWQIAAAVGLVFFVALVIRALRLDIVGLNGDEILQAWLAQTPNNRGGFRGYLGSIAGGSLMQQQPPVTYALARWSIDLFGWNLFGFRLPALLAGAVMPAYLTFFFGSRVSPIFGFFTGLIPATYYWYTGISSQARPYAMVALLGAVAFTYWSLPINDAWRKRFPRGFYAIVTLVGVFTNLFYFIVFGALSVLDLICGLCSRVKEARKAYFQKVIEFWVPALVFSPYLYLMIRKTEKQGHYTSAKNFSEQVSHVWRCIKEGITLIPEIFQTSFYLEYSMALFLISCVGMIFLWIRGQRLHALLLVFSSFWAALALGFAFNYGGMSWWGDNYVTSLRVIVFCVAITILGKLWLERDLLLKGAVTGVLCLLLLLTTSELKTNWRAPFYEDWIAASKFIQTLPADTELRFVPQWTYDLNYFLISKILKTEFRKAKMTENPARICSVYNRSSDVNSPDNVSGTDFGLIYSYSKVYIDCVKAK